MNISLSKTQSKKSNLGLGLNNRRSQPAATLAQAAPIRNVFLEDDEDSDNDKANSRSGRDQVNQDLAAEQAALRKRAATAAAALDPSIYDYDGVVDDRAKMTANSTNNDAKEPKKSRYVADLMQAAKRREKERDVILERKVAKEIAQEEQEYQGTEKFITKAYKQKLMERELWLQDEEARQREEDKNDVTKTKTGDAVISSFYGNLHRNVAMGGGKDQHTTTSNTRELDQVEAGTKVDHDTGPISSNTSGGAAATLGFADGFELSVAPEMEPVDSIPTLVETPEMKEASMRRVREEKVALARQRYFQRNGISVESVKH